MDFNFGELLGTGMLDSITKYGIIGVLLLAIGLVFLLVIGAVFYTLSFQYTCKYWEVVGGMNGKYALGKMKKNRFGWTDKKKTTWRMLYPLNPLSPQKMRPFDPIFLHGNTTYAYKLPDGVYVPIRHSVEKMDDAEFVGTLNAIPASIREWHEQEMRETAEQIIKKDWKADLWKFTVPLVVLILVCGAVVAFQAYFMFEGGRQVVEYRMDEQQSCREAISDLAVVLRDWRVESAATLHNVTKPQG